MLLLNLDLLATAPGGVARLRELILTLAVQGKLLPQDPADEPASALLKKIRAEKDRLIADGKIKRDKPLAGISEEEQPFEVPAGWEWVRCADYFVELCTGPFGSVIHQEDYVFDGVPLINPSHMVGGRIVHDPRVTLKLEDAERLSAYALSAGDLVLARRGEVGRYALVTEREHGWLCGTGSFFVRLHKACNREYLGLLFTDARFRQHLQGQSVGTTMTNLNQRILLDALIALPPLAEQSRIVTRVEELMRLCDALEAKGRLEAAQHAQLVTTLLAALTDSATPEALAGHWQRLATHFDTLLDRPEAVDAMEQTLLQLAVRGLLVPQDPADEPASVLLKKIRTEKDRLIAAGQIKRDKPLEPIAEDDKPFEVPAGWEWTRMGELVNASEAGWSPTCIGSPRRDGFWGVLKVSAVSWGAFDANANKELPAILSPRPEYEVKDGDFLLSRANTEELVARSVVVGKAESRLMLSDKIIRLDVSSQMNRQYLNICNNAGHARAHYASNASGTSSSMKNVSREVVLSTPVPLPPLAEQSRIVARVEALRRLCADLRQRLAASQTAQAQLAGALVESVSN
jgi:type I restriction enzyme S subunit